MIAIFWKLSQDPHRRGTDMEYICSNSSPLEAPRRTAYPRHRLDKPRLIGSMVSPAAGEYPFWDCRTMPILVTT